MANCLEKNWLHKRIRIKPCYFCEAHEHRPAPIATDTTGGRRGSLGACGLPLPAQRRGRRGRTAPGPCWWPQAARREGVRQPFGGTQLNAPRLSASTRVGGRGGSQGASLPRATRPAAATAPGSGQQAQAGPRPARQPPPPSRAGRAPVATGLRPKAPFG